MRRPALSALLVALVLAPALVLPRTAHSEEPMAVVVSREWTGFETVSLSTLRRLYLGRIRRIAGRRVQRFHLQPGSPVRQTFSLRVLGRSEAALREYWLEQALTGGVAPPGEFASARAMLQHVSAHVGAIGYAPASEVEGFGTERLRVVGLVTEHGVLRPADPAYPIRPR